MKKFIYFIFILIMLISLIFYLLTKYPSIDILPDKYSLHRQKSFLLWTHRVEIFKIKKNIDLNKIDNYPKSKELGGYNFKKWCNLNDEDKKDVIEYLDYSSQSCRCNKPDISKLISDLKKNKNDFLFSKIGIIYREKMENKIGLSYFFLINRQSGTLYAFEMQPNM